MCVANVPLIEAAVGNHGLSRADTVVTKPREQPLRQSEAPRSSRPLRLVENSLPWGLIWRLFPLRRRRYSTRKACSNSVEISRLQLDFSDRAVTVVQDVSLKPSSKKELKLEIYVIFQRVRDTRSDKFPLYRQDIARSKNLHTYTCRVSAIKLFYSREYWDLSTAHFLIEIRSYKDSTTTIYIHYRPSRLLENVT